VRTAAGARREAALKDRVRLAFRAAWSCYGLAAAVLFDGLWDAAKALARDGTAADALAAVRPYAPWAALLAAAGAIIHAGYRWRIRRAWRDPRLAHLFRGPLEP
jgi:hypothetical protein